VLASALEITFMLLVGGVTVLAGLFGLYLLVQLFRNPSRR
jgi:ABC-type phosphate transport system permease subunit